MSVTAKEVLTSREWVLTSVEITRDGKRVFIEAKKRFGTQCMCAYITKAYAKRLGVNIEAAVW